MSGDVPSQIWDLAVFKDSYYGELPPAIGKPKENGGLMVVNDGILSGL